MNMKRKETMFLTVSLFSGLPDFKVVIKASFSAGRLTGRSFFIHFSCIIVYLLPVNGICTSCQNFRTHSLVILIL